MNVDPIARLVECVDRLSQHVTNLEALAALTTERLRRVEDDLLKLQITQKSTDNVVKNLLDGTA